MTQPLPKSNFMQPLVFLKMSINCVMLTQDGKAPIPLPQKNMLFTQPDAKLGLEL